MAKISPHAVVDPSASLAQDVEIGSFCVVGSNVTLGPGCRLMNNVTLFPHVRAGRDNVFWPNCVMGGDPQDRKYKPSGTDPTRLEIGDGNSFRENVTIHVGTEKGGRVTRIGSNNFFMVNSHVGHDGQIGNNCLLANNVMLAGHVIVGDSVSLMGGVGVHQFVTIGEFSYIGGLSRIHHDVPPFSKVDGADLVRGFNPIPLRRAGVSARDIEMLEVAHRHLFNNREKPLAVAMAEFDMMNGINPLVKRLIEFLHRRGASKHGRHQEAAMRR